MSRLQKKYRLEYCVGILHNAPKLWRTITEVEFDFGSKKFVSIFLYPEI